MAMWGVRLRIGGDGHRHPTWAVGGYGAHEGEAWMGAETMGGRGCVHCIDTVKGGERVERCKKVGRSDGRNKA